VIQTGAAKLVEYDNTSANDEMAWRLGLGCNGIVRVLIEPVTATSPHIEALRRSREEVVTIELRAPSGAARRDAIHATRDEGARVTSTKEVVVAA
jgi:xanthine/CO dehydrogenase XdhC/CoxF family maturation factor